MDGYIKLHRQFLSWEWYRDANTLRVFLHLLLNVSHKDFKYCGKELKAGQLITGRKKLAAELKMTEQEIRTAIAHLKNTGEINQQSTSQYSIITVKNWKLYQEINQQSTSNQPLNKNVKKDKLLHNLSNEENFQNLSSEWWELLKDWLEYKQAKKQSYKNERSLRAFINKLLKLSNGDLLKAKGIIEESMANNWNGIFEVNKPAKNSLKVVSTGMNYTPDEPIMEKNKRIRETASEMPQEFKDFKTKLKGIIYDTGEESA